MKMPGNFAHKDSDSPDLMFQKNLLGIISYFLLICGTAWTFMYYAIFGWSVPAYAALLFAINAVIMILFARITKNHIPLVYSIFYACTAAPVVAQWSMGSLHDGGMTIIWGFLTPLGILIFASLRPAIISLVVFFICMLITIIYEPVYLGPKLVATELSLTVMTCLNVCISFTVLFATCAWFVHTIKVQKEISEHLLLNILPTEVAEELKKYGKVEPVFHENCTVLFTDFKGFTEISTSITAKELVEEINHCFGEFDKITTKYNIEKIKTIGDSYMAVGGKFSPNECTPWHVVSAGLEMQEFIIKRKREREKEGKFGFEMRAGVHSGSVISGVVGVKKFQFDIWGDTVNIASRMENHGEVEKLNVSGATYDLVADKFDFEYRGEFTVKGKGEMRMYYASLPKEKKA